MSTAADHTTSSPAGANGLPAASPLPGRPAPNGAGTVASPVDWQLAARVAARVSRRDPYAGLVAPGRLEADFTALTEQAEVLVARDHAEAFGMVNDRYGTPWMVGGGEQS